MSSPRARLALSLARGSCVWVALPVMLGVDVFVATSRGTPWRGEAAWCVESMAPAMVLLAPLLAGVAAWEARRDNRLDDGGVLRSLVDGHRHGWVRFLVMALVAAGAQLLVLLVLVAVSVHTARIGVWPVGSVLVQLAAVPPLVAFGRVVGRLVDHVVAPVFAAMLAIAVGYADYLTRLPLGLVSDGSTGTLVGYHPSLLAVAARVLWCAAVTGGCLVILGAGFAYRPVLRRSATGAVVLLLVASTLAVRQRPFVWVPAAPPLSATRCLGELPRTCVLPDFSRQLPRLAALVSATSRQLRRAGATGLPTTFVGWWPTVSPSTNTVFAVAPGTADRPADASEVVPDVVAPTGCWQWHSSTALPVSAYAAAQLVVEWLGRQDPGLVPTQPDPRHTAFFAQTPARQRSWVALAATDLASCRLTAIPSPPGLA